MTWFLRFLAFGAIGGIIGALFLWWGHYWMVDEFGAEAAREFFAQPAFTILSPLVLVPICALTGAGYSNVSRKMSGPWVHVQTATTVLGFFIWALILIKGPPLLPPIWGFLASLVVGGLLFIAHAWVFRELNRRSGWPPPEPDSPPSP